MAEDATAAASSSGPPPAEGEKPKRGKPKDPLAPKKPQNAYQRVSAASRPKILEEKPELKMDLKGMAEAMKAEWDKVPEEEKQRLTKIYEEEMEIWKPKWAAYKETDHYKEFFEIKQDWIDKRQLKKMIKKGTPGAPKRPRSGYMIFAGEVRDRIKEEVFKNGGGLGDVGKNIAEEWAALTETKKAEYGEQSSRQKEVFDVEIVKYRKTDEWKNFLQEKAKLEAKQGLKKNQRVSMQEAPKKPPSSYGLFRSEVMAKIAEDNKGLSCGELGKKVAAAWVDVPEDKKAEYAEKAGTLKEEYDKKIIEFKRNQKYVEFLEKRAKIKKRENLLVNLHDMPKRPKSVFAMFADQHKTEVPQGKGEGKGRSALKQKFAEEQYEAERKALAEKEEEMRKQWKLELEEYKRGERYQGYLKQEKSIKTEFMNEAMKVMTIKFLRDAPPQPPRSSFAVFVSEKRKAVEGTEGEPPKKKSKTEVKDELTTYKLAFSKLDKMTRAEYENTRKEKIAAWKDEAKKYMAEEKWQEYVKEAKKLKVPVKNLLMQKSQVMKKLKNGMPVVSLPEKPADMPSKPPDARKLYWKKMKEEGKKLDEIQEMWDKLDQEGKAPFVGEANEMAKAFEDNMIVFKKSDEGKAYYKDLKIASRRKKGVYARFTFLKDMPKKSPGAIQLFLKKQVPLAKKASPEMKGHELRKTVEDKWKALSDEERKAYTDEASTLYAAFQEKMKEFKEGENWKKYVKMTRPVAKKAKKFLKKVVKKGKGGGKGGSVTISGPKKPADMPTKPDDIAKAFCNAYLEDKANAGKGKKEAMQAWVQLPDDDKKARKAKYEEDIAEYNTAFDTFKASPAGKKYFRECQLFQIKKVKQLAKDKFLKGKPKAPPNAYFIFVSEKRADVARENPDLKGLGPIGKKLNEVWTKLTDEERNQFKQKEKDAIQKHDEEMEKFRETDDWKKYTAAIRRIDMKSSGGRVKGKGKGGAGTAAPSIKMPEMPEGMPVKPDMPFKAWMKATKPGGLAKANEEWRNLGAEGQKKWTDDCAEKTKQYEKDLAEFMKKAEGKKYMREKRAAEHKQKMAAAKASLSKTPNLPAEPKRPPSGYFLWMGQEGRKGDDIKNLPFKEQAAAMSKKWNAFGEEEKKVWEGKAAEMKTKYEEEMVAYKANPAVKAYYKRMQSLKSRPKPKVAAKAAKAAKPAAKVKAAKPAAGRGRGAAAGAGRGRGRGAAAPAAKADAAGSDSDSDVMGSDSDDSSSSNESD